MCLKTIPPFKWLYTFMNTPDEWHAFVIGFGDGYCPWEKKYKPTREMIAIIRREIWYYHFGTAVGFALLILSMAGAVALVVGAIT
jgi:hypothetical protein